MALYHIENNEKWYWKPYFKAFESTFHGYALREASFCVSPHYTTFHHHAPPLATSHHFTTLNHYHTTILPHHHIIILIHYHITLLSLYSTKLFPSSLIHFITLNHYHTNTLSLYHITTLPRYHFTQLNSLHPVPPISLHHTKSLPR